MEDKKPMSIKEMLTQFDNIKAEHKQAIKAIDSLTELAEQCYLNYK